MVFKPELTTGRELLSFPGMTTYLTIEQLKRAIQIEEQIEALRNQLNAVLSGVNTGKVESLLNTVMALGGRKGKRSAATRAKMAAAQKARWAQKNGGAVEADAVAQKPAKKKKRKMSPEGRARIIEAQKKRWAALKGKKGE